jgi:hypothetical protein
MTSAERRKSPRYAVRVPVRMEAEGASAEGHLHDICRDAIFVESDRTWPADTELGLSMDLPGTDGTVEARGRVVRVTTGEPGAQGMAVIFTETTPTAVGRIDLFLGKQS